MLHSQLRVPRRFTSHVHRLLPRKGAREEPSLFWVPRLEALCSQVWFWDVESITFASLARAFLPRQDHNTPLNTGLTAGFRFCEDPPTARHGLSHLPPGRRKLQEGAALPTAQPSPPGLLAALFPEGRFQTSWGTVVPTSAAFLEKRHKESQLLRGGWLSPEEAAASGGRREHV